MMFKNKKAELATVIAIFVTIGLVAAIVALNQIQGPTGLVTLGLEEIYGETEIILQFNSTQPQTIEFDLNNPDFTSASISITGDKLNGSLPSNVSVDILNNGNIDWGYLGELNSTETIEFVDILNPYLENCGIFPCPVQIQITTETNGIIILNSLIMEYAGEPEDTNETINQTVEINQTETPEENQTVEINQTTEETNETMNETINQTVEINQTETPEENQTIEISLEGEIYQEGELIEKDNKQLGEKLEDEPDYETYFVDIEKTNTTLTVVFYHDYNATLPITIEGDIDYSLSSENASYLENITLIVNLIDSIVPKFELHVGETSEIFEFGKTIPTVDISGGNYSIIDRDDLKLDVEITKGQESIDIQGVQDETQITAKIT
ncbi:MAG: hypothetical protein V3V78_02080, partial [Candidatus Woesearchaeota archaeon]